MDQGNASELSGGKMRDGMVIELASKTRLTERRWWMLQMDGEAGDEVLGVHRAVSVALDPENPPGTNGLTSWWQLDELEGPILD